MGTEAPHLDCRFTIAPRMQPTELTGAPRSPVATAFFCPATALMYSLTVDSPKPGIRLWTLPLADLWKGWRQVEMKGDIPRDCFIQDHSFCIIGTNLYTIQPPRGPGDLTLYRLSLAPDRAAQWTSLPLSGLTDVPSCYCPLPSGQLYVQSAFGHAAIDVETGAVTRYGTPAPELSNDGAVVAGRTYCGVPNGVVRLDEASQTWQTLFTFDLDHHDFLWLDHRGLLYVLSFSACTLTFLFRFHLATGAMEYVQCRKAIVMPPCDLDFWLCFSYGSQFYIAYGLDGMLLFDPDQYLVPWSPPGLRFQSLVNSSLYSDVQFSVQGERFHAHRALVALCPVLRAFLDRDTDASAVVTVQDTAPEVFGSVLYFLYTGVLGPKPLDAPAMLELFYLANKYCLPELTFLCESALLTDFQTMTSEKDPLTFTDVLPYLEAAFLVREGGVLYTACMRAVLRGFIIHMHDPEFQALHVRHPRLHSQILGLASRCIKVDEEAIDRLSHLDLH